MDERTTQPIPPAKDRPIEERVDRAAAYVEGTVEGLAEGAQRHGLPQATHKAIDQADRFVRQVRHGGRQSFERPSPVARKLHEATGRTQAGLDQAAHAVGERVEDIKHKAHAVAETTRRAAAAPAEVSKDLGKAVSSWAGGFVAGLGWMLAAGAVGAAAFVLATMGLVALLTPVLGTAGALFLVGGVYVAAAFACLGMAKAARKLGQKKAEAHIGEARQELQRVAEPVREAFGHARPLAAAGRPQARLQNPPLSPVKQYPR